MKPALRKIFALSASAALLASLSPAAARRR